MYILMNSAGILGYLYDIRDQDISHDLNIP